ncbi:MAG: thioredoxin [Gammaproteobacteria bacterium]|nr:MAG: thioredoxin [Gammaproteobacteria bacterium]
MFHFCQDFLTGHFSQKAIVDKTRKGFDVIAINMWGDRDVTGLDGKETTEKQFAVDNRIMFTPTLLFLNENGKQVLRLNGYYPPNKFMIALDYVAGKHEKMPYRDYLAKNAPAPTSGKIHAEHANLKNTDFAARTGDKPLIVMFEQKNCEACDELHDDILQQPESRELLKSYDVAVLDMWSKTPVTTPAGEKTTAKQWAKKLHVQYAPSMVFFDPGGKEVFRTEAWLRGFHTQSALDYVASGAYKTQPEFQRYIEARADDLRAKGIDVEIMK